MRLFRGKKSTPYNYVLVDSGADKAVFDPSAAPLLGITDYMSGQPETNVGIGGTSTAWYHKGICVAIKDSSGNRTAIALDQAGFDPGIPIAGLVGRQSFFEAFRVTFEEANKQVILELQSNAPNIIDWNRVPYLLPPRPGGPKGPRRR